jgi:hypothetical protein
MDLRIWKAAEEMKRQACLETVDRRADIITG